MTVGRFKNGRYQQGIGTHDTLGVQPTSWSEPQPPALKRMTFTPANSGANRNYGSTPDYVDTLNSRWQSPQGGNWIKGALAKGKNMQNQTKAQNAQAETDAFDTRSASDLGISVDELRSRRSADADFSRLGADADVVSRTRAAGWTP